MSRAALSVSPRASRSAKLREEVFARDRGVCSLCRVDTEALRLRLEALRAHSAGSLAKSSAYREACRELGIRAGQELWESDHETPLVEGGSDTIDNARTLCAFGTPRSPGCHQRETKILAARRATRPRAKATRAVFDESYEVNEDRIVRLTDDGQVDGLVAEFYGSKERYENARVCARALNAARKPQRRRR